MDSIAKRMVELVHYSKKPLGKIKSAKQQAEPDIKPIGLWVSDDACPNNWRSWCEAETFGIERLAVRTSIKLAPAARILLLGSANDIDKFSGDFGRPYSFHRGEKRSDLIDWMAVAKEWQGIIITPYIWERRLEGGSRWYYGWDCASGCIWDHRAIRQLSETDNATG